MSADTPLGHYRIIHDPTPEHDMDGAAIHLIEIHINYGVEGNNFGIATYHPSALPQHIFTQFRVNFGVELEPIIEANFEPESIPPRRTLI